MTAPAMELAEVELCPQCLKRPRGQRNKQRAIPYQPFCSYACQEKKRLDDAFAYLRGSRAAGASKEL